MTNTYFTQNFADLNDSRKIEVIMEQLVRIAQYKDLQFETLQPALDALATMREHVAS